MYLFKINNIYATNNKLRKEVVSVVAAMDRIVLDNREIAFIFINKLKEAVLDLNKKNPRCKPLEFRIYEHLEAGVQSSSINTYDIVLSIDNTCLSTLYASIEEKEVIRD